MGGQQMQRHSRVDSGSDSELDVRHLVPRALPNVVRDMDLRQEVERSHADPVAYSITRPYNTESSERANQRLELADAQAAFAVLHKEALRDPEIQQLFRSGAVRLGARRRD